MNKKHLYWLAAGSVLVVVVWIYSGPQNFNECVLDKLEDVHTDKGAFFAQRVCRAKFPAPTPPPNIFDKYDNQTPAGEGRTPVPITTNMTYEEFTRKK